MGEKGLIKSKLDVSKFIKKVLIPHVQYEIVRADPAIGIIYIVNNFISGHVRLLGRGEGQYPYKYLEMINSVFGEEMADETLEVCSGTRSQWRDCITVDINPEIESHFPIDGQDLVGIPDNSFSRWRCDPPYNEETARAMYHCEMPSLMKLLKAGARVVKPGSLLFLLCTENYQHHPPSLKRIGLILITVVPNNEIRALNIYVKLKNI